MNPRDPGRETRSGAGMLATQGIITLVVAVLASLALDDITTDNATQFVPEYWILATAGGWALFVASNLLRRGNRAVALTSVLAVGAAAWVAFDGLGHKRDGGWSSFWPEYAVISAAWSWFVALAAILLAFSRRAANDERAEPS